MEQYIFPFLTFLLGALVTSFGFVLSFSIKLGKLETKMDNMISLVNSVCTDQNKILDTVNINSQRISRLEAYRNGSVVKT